MRMHESQWCQHLDYWKVAFRCFGCREVGHMQRECPKARKESHFKKIWVRKEAVKTEAGHEFGSSKNDGAVKLQSDIGDKKTTEESNKSENKQGGEHGGGRAPTERNSEEGKGRDKLRGRQQEEGEIKKRWRTRHK